MYISGDNGSRREARKVRDIGFASGTSALSTRDARICDRTQNNSLCALFLGRSTCVLKPALLVLFSDILLLIRPPEIIYVRRLLSARNRTGGSRTGAPDPVRPCTQTLSTLPSPPFLPWGPCHRTHGRTGYSAVR